MGRPFTYRKVTVHDGKREWVIKDVISVEYVGKNNKILLLIDNKTNEHCFSDWCHVIEEPMEYSIA